MARNKPDRHLSEVPHIRCRPSAPCYTYSLRDAMMRFQIITHPRPVRRIALAAWPPRVRTAQIGEQRNREALPDVGYCQHPRLIPQNHKSEKRGLEKSDTTLPV